MRSYFSLIIAMFAMQNDLFAAEVGMPQLDPKYWASQAFWLILIFSKIKAKKIFSCFSEK